MFKAFQAYIKEEQLFTKKDKVLLAVSGGVDSMVMVSLFDQSNWKFGVAHCDFSLRGQESDSDAKFVEKYIDELDIPFYKKKFNTSKFGKEHKISIQEAARILRYEWLEKIRKKENYDYIATAHHINDSLETVLFNFVKGTGIRGMHGILPKQKHIIRPMLFANKEDILTYAKWKRIAYREDSSNSSDKYTRNYVRHQVIPKLKEINPLFEKTAYQNIRIFREVEELYQFSIAYIKEQVYQETDKGFKIDIKKLKHLPAPNSVLFELLKSADFNRQQVEQVFKACNGQSGKLFFSQTHQLLIDRKYLIIEPKPSKEFIPIEILKNNKLITVGDRVLELQILPAEGLKISKDTNQTYFDLDKLTFPLELRKWKKGDKFCPFGMKGKHKLISDVLINAKLNLFEKEAVLVLESGNQICWVVGIRSDERFKVDHNTKQVLHIKQNNL